jgi:hypothetical protein
MAIDSDGFAALKRPKTAPEAADDSQLSNQSSHVNRYAMVNDHVAAIVNLRCCSRFQSEILVEARAGEPVHEYASGPSTALR